LGDLIQALTPMADVVRVAEWYTIEHKVSYLQSVISHTPAATIGSWTINRYLSDWQRVDYRAKTRVPTDLGRHLGLVFKQKMNTGKSLAAISLAIQQLTKGRA
jgi:hypothetical protein